MTHPKSRRIAMAGLTLAFMLAAGSAAAVQYTVETGPGVSVALAHEGARVLAEEPYTVYAPDANEPFQHGLTDSRGRATFLPNQPGRWRVDVTPAGAEPLSITVEVDEAAVRALPHQGLGAFAVATAAFGYLVGLAGILMIWRASRSTYLARSERGP
jgi:nickel transport protein